MDRPEKKYQPINLPVDLVGELKVWKRAFSNCYNRSITYGEMFRTMLDSMEDYEPGVAEEMERMVEAHPELLEKIGKYRGLLKDNESTGAVK